MLNNYNFMKKSKEPFFEMSNEDEIVLHIDNLSFKGEDGLYNFKLYVIDIVKNINNTILVSTIDNHTRLMMMDEKYKYETVAFQFDMMLDDIAIRKHITKKENLLKVKDEKEKNSWHTFS